MKWCRSVSTDVCRVSCVVRRARLCAVCRAEGTGLYFGNGVAERVWETQLCNHAVLLRGNYCSLACLHSHTATPLCSHTH